MPLSADELLEQQNFEEARVLSEPRLEDGTPSFPWQIPWCLMLSSPWTLRDACYHRQTQGGWCPYQWRNSHRQRMRFLCLSYDEEVRASDSVLTAPECQENSFDHDECSNHSTYECIRRQLDWGICEMVDEGSLRPMFRELYGVQRSLCPACHADPGLLECADHEDARQLLHNAMEDTLLKIERARERIGYYEAALDLCKGCWHAVMVSKAPGEDYCAQFLMPSIEVLSGFGRSRGAATQALKDIFLRMVSRGQCDIPLGHHDEDVQRIPRMMRWFVAAPDMRKIQIDYCSIVFKRISHAPVYKFYRIQEKGSSLQDAVQNIRKLQRHMEQASSGDHEVTIPVKVAYECEDGLKWPPPDCAGDMPVNKDYEDIM